MSKTEGLKKKIERLENFYNGIRTLVRNLGKSNVMMKDDVEELLMEFEK